jgi:integrase
LTVKDVVNAFLAAKESKIGSGELSPLTFRDYKLIAAELLTQVGKGRLLVDLDARDFAALRRRMATRWGPHRLAKLCQYTRTMFKWAFDAGLIDRPVRFGPDFKRPSKKTIRLNRAARGKQMFTAEEIRRMLGTAGPILRAMILLAINVGLGNADVGGLSISNLDLDAGLLDFPRPKTGIERRATLWPETIASIREVLEQRPSPKREADAGLVFLTQTGAPWARDNDPAIVTKEFRKLLDKLDINGSRNFYALRHTYRTIADEARDQPVVDLSMGHESTHMSSTYRESISTERLRAVAEYVQRWLLVGPWPQDVLQ